MTTISGLYYKPEALTLGGGVLEKLDEANAWKQVTPGLPNSRRVIHFGTTYDYSSRSVSVIPCDPIPDFLLPLQALLREEIERLGLNTEGHELNQCIVNEYLPGQGISKHIDKLSSFGPIIGCFTLGSSATMVFRRNEEKVDQFVEPNSLYIMSGDARTVWTHEMPGRLTDMDPATGKKIKRTRRVSVTFRSVVV
jgi:alkylated DNA repair dioxygenase AlkB